MFHVLRPVVVYEQRQRVTVGWRCHVCRTVWDDMPPLEERDRCPGEGL